MQDNYNFLDIEQKWQKQWDNLSVFSAEINNNKPKYYVLEMLPYPSGKIHMGHVRNYSIGDVIARYKTQKGFNVLHPMGWDAFGLPAENAAIEKKTHPKKWTYENIENMKDELKKLGFSYDWSKEVATCDPSYYKHQQKIFLDFFKNGLAYRKESLVNWDPVDQTVLSNEQVENGRGWRSGALVEQKKLTQWFMKITDFADDLVNSLEKLDNWPDHVKLMQEKWIGKSRGSKIKFPIENSEEYVEVYTTVPETLFGASFCAIAFDHPISQGLVKKNPSIKTFIEESSLSGTSEEDVEKAEKLGFDTGIKLTNPVNPNQTIPLFIANFVLMDYGTGAIFGCPAHDARDFEFATKYKLPIKRVVERPNKETDLPLKVETTDILIESEFLNGLTSKEAREKIIDYFEKENIGQATTQYRLRDWGVSRQRYWGCPIPMIYCPSCGVVPVPAKDLPVQLPEDVTIGGNGNPLDHHPTWKNVSCPKCGKEAKRETDTLDTFFDSSWYFLRYCNNETSDTIDREAVKYWLPVDQYIGGIEHAVLHLLYARFFVKALSKCGYPHIDEPFLDLLPQGMVTHMSYKDKNGKWVDPCDIENKGEKIFQKQTGEEAFPYRIEKMSKSKKNVVPPLPILEKYGADTARLFTLSDSPPEKNIEWTDSGVEGCYKFLNKLYIFTKDFIKNIDINLSIDSKELSDSQKSLQQKIHSTIKTVSENIENKHLNKAIASIRELTNEVYRYKSNASSDKAIVKEALKASIQLLNPFVPHITEELWSILGETRIIANSQWPSYDEAMLQQNSKKIVIQVNGKLKLVSNFPQEATEEEIKAYAFNESKVKAAIDNKEIRKVIYIQNKLVNIVV